MLAIYGYLCLAIFIVTISIGVYEDVTGRYDPKFGKNMTNGMFWVLTILLSTPLHFIVIGVILWSRFSRGRHDS